MKILFVTGASGSGKTTLLKELESVDKLNASYYYFDSIGVPSHEEMVRDYGSGDEWQRQTTQVWLDRILSDNKRDIAILDGQMRLAFILDACRQKGFENYKIILVDCNDRVRRNRLAKRGQPELASEDMMNWAAYLRREAVDIGATVLDTSGLSRQYSQRKLRELLEN